MPPKPKAPSKAKEQKAPAAGTPPPPTPRTINERSQQRFEAANPLQKSVAERGLSGLSPAERQTWACANYVRSITTSSTSSYKKQGGSGSNLSNKALRDVWRTFNDLNLPLRTLKQPSHWGRDNLGRDIGELTPEQFASRVDRRARLTVLQAAHRAFLDRRDRAASGGRDPVTGDPVVVTDDEINEERERRREMADLRRELYGQSTGSLAADPTWDDVVPIPLDEPEGALAAIAYPDDYAEAISYLRAVMANKEYSPRCLRLTEHVISMNPAHYTVWLYRFSIIEALGLSIPDELEWLNSVALEHLKNYQIWHHRHLLVDSYYPRITADKPDKVARLAASEREFIASMLKEDTKNYHVWSYRQFLVRRLGCWRDADERAAVERLVDDDVRNNSAWSHRFFLVFSDPAQSTPGSHATDHDPAVPKDVIDREVEYSQQKIKLAPQNQSPWNYLRGVLVKAGRPLADVEDFAASFVTDLGDVEKEETKSTHALDFLAEIYAQKGNKEKAVVCLDSLSDRWDPIRKGYWDWRKRTVLEGDTKA